MWVSPTATVGSATAAVGARGAADMWSATDGPVGRGITGLRSRAIRARRRWTGGAWPGIATIAIVIAIVGRRGIGAVAFIAGRRPIVRIVLDRGGICSAGVAARPRRTIGVTRAC